MLKRWMFLGPALSLLYACGEAEPPVHLRVAGGDPERGRSTINAYGCGSCHTIPGVSGPRGVAGPPLDGFAARSFIGGTLPNTPPFLVAWLQDPPAFAPKTAMPNLGVSPEEARDMAAYLYTLGTRPAPMAPSANPGGERDSASPAAAVPAGYGWADRDGGLAVIPVERAIELMESRSVQ